MEPDDDLVFQDQGCLDEPVQVESPEPNESDSPQDQDVPAPNRP